MPLSIRLPKDLEDKLAAEARLSHKKRAEVLREALTAHLRALERERFLGKLVQASKAIDREESLAVSEEFLPLDNEALDIAEGRKPGDPWPHTWQDK